MPAVISPNTDQAGTQQEKSESEELKPGVRCNEKRIGNGREDAKPFEHPRSIHPPNLLAFDLDLCNFQQWSRS